jgi:hypothetical protein
MNHFLRKHRYWFLALVIIAVVGLLVFQVLDFDEGPAGDPVPAEAPAGGP